MISRRSLLAALGLAATAPRIALAQQAEPWPDWQIVSYQPQTDAQLATLKRIGVTNGKLIASRNDKAGNPLNPEAARFAKLDMRFYVESIGTDFYSAYHRWYPDRPDDAAFIAAKARHRRDPQDKTAFIRDPGLSDPVWLRRIHDRITRIAHEYAPYRPLYYSLADEPGIADLAAAWDFDIAPTSLAAMRVWLQTTYPSLAALNHQWGSNFATWADITPTLTDAAVRQSSRNFSSWADFKRWMAIAFARAVRMGTDAVHAVDPNGLVAIEGAQVPGFGGYDYEHLAHAVDVMEIYEAGENIEIARSLNPALILLRTISSGDPRQTHRLWRSALLGMRGTILWNESDTLVNKDGTLGPWGQQAAPVFAELRGRLGRTLLAASRADDGIATLYSPASLRTQWLLDRRAEWRGQWENRSSSAETNDNGPARVAIRRFAAMVMRSRLQGHYTAPSLIEQGALRTGRINVLLLPHIIALSSKAATEIRHFVASGGTAIADVVPGRFDDHSRRLPTPQLADLFHTAHRAILSDGADLLAETGLEPRFSLTTADGKPADNVSSYRFDHHGSTIIALHRDFDAVPSRQPVIIKFNRPASVRDARTLHAFGTVGTLSLDLDPVTPTFLIISPSPA